MKLDEIQSHLQNVWQPSSASHLIPLAIGFLYIHFNDENDMRKIWGSGTCMPLSFFPQFAESRLCNRFTKASCGCEKLPGNTEIARVSIIMT
ncbi:hypothetical protein WN943_001167 [Citrus x changshan-huyou]